MRGPSLAELSRGLLIGSLRAVLRVALRWLSHVVPPGRSVLVSAFPETEGNGVEVARALLGRYDGRVVWLTDGHEPHPDVLALARQGLELVEKASLRGLARYLRAEVVFFTHGLYGSPRPCRRKPLVNLWHGDGPKATRPPGKAGSVIPSTYLVAGTELFGRLKAAAFEIPRERLLVTGNPRTDQFWQQQDRSALRGLGIEGDFVVWMPTFRKTRPLGAVRRWSDSGSTGEGDGSPEHDLLGEVRFLQESLRARGIQLVVKPHPLDADRRRWDDVLTVSERDLVRAGIGCYSLLAQSRGLVTDYSSTWVDYLLLDRPLAFLVPDASTYARELDPADVLDWLPGPRVGGGRGFQAFLEDLDAEGAEGAVLRKEVAARIGLNTTRTSADDLVTTLAGLGVLRSHG